MKQVLKNGLLVLVTIAVGLLALGGAARPERAGQSRLLKLSDYKFLDINTINCTINSDGTYADERRTGQAGMEWPKGSGETCVFTAGLWVGGLHHPTGTIRTACMDYAAEYQPGPLLETFNTTTNDGTLPNNRAADNKWRLYKINKTDIKNPGGNVDYTDWPGDAGAPFVDVNGNGVWDPGIDQPKF